MNKQFENMQKLAFGKKLLNESAEKMTKSAFKKHIKEMILNEISETKKKKNDEEDVAPQEDVDINAEMPADVPTDTMAPEVGNIADINPTVKSIQDSLQKAFAQAKELGDAKLVTQIGNTITMLVRDQVLGGGQQAVAEGMEGTNEKEKYGSDDPRSLDELEKAILKHMKVKESGKGNIKVGNEINILYSIYKNKGGKKTKKTLEAVTEGMEEMNDEIFKKISAAVSDEDYNRFIDAATAISEDLISKGFEAEDIYDYLNNITLNEA